MVDESEIHIVSAVAVGECVIFEIERDKLEQFKEDDKKSWMENLLSTPLFEFVPPSNIQRCLSALNLLPLVPIKPSSLKGMKGTTSMSSKQAG